MVEASSRVQTSYNAKVSRWYMERIYQPIISALEARLHLSMVAPWVLKISCCNRNIELLRRSMIQFCQRWIQMEEPSSWRMITMDKRSSVMLAVRSVVPRSNLEAGWPTSSVRIRWSRVTKRWLWMGRVATPGRKCQAWSSSPTKEASHLSSWWTQARMIVCSLKSRKIWYLKAEMASTRVNLATRPHPKESMERAQN